MTFDPSTYQSRLYPNPPCWALVADVYATERGHVVENYTPLSTSIRTIAATFRMHLRAGTHGFERISKPQDLTFVLLGQSSISGPHHAGIYWRGSVLHALGSGVLFQDLASVRDAYALVEFWDRGLHHSPELRT